MNGFAADGNMFVKKVKQRLEVRDCMRAMTRPQPLISVCYSGTGTRTRRTCPSAPSLVLSRRCCTRSASSPTMSTIFSVELRKMVSQVSTLVSPEPPVFLPLVFFADLVFCLTREVVKVA